jgi:hypothetical protein
MQRQKNNFILDWPVVSFFALQLRALLLGQRPGL